ncbi:barrier-to-autointegration factor-like [Genypterus blacodes]|uniref:barrier-to-autointegration factor-like n=1 Tax=Genypterus blacodes TaxID=154954 RepID=UPI003F76BEE6
MMFFVRTENPSISKELLTGQCLEICNPTKAVMPLPSKKHEIFVSEPMGEKRVTELAGIGEALGSRLTEKGFSMAVAALGQFLALRKDEQKFMSWLKDICGANLKQQKECYECLKEWSEAFL